LNATTLAVHFSQDGHRLTVRSWIQALCDQDAGHALEQAIAESGFDAVFWECPPVRDTTLDDPFECVLVHSSALARVKANPAPFRHVLDSAAPVATFDNLGGDATLVVPTSQASNNCYPHLAQFCRTAPDDQRRAVWRALGEAIHPRVQQRPIWVSTSGLGVYWLHFRLDSRPKYYTHRPYRAVP